MRNIRLAYMMATPEIVRNENVTAYQGDLEKGFRVLRDAGYDGVEFMTRDPQEDDIRSIARMAEAFGMDVPMLCTGEMYGQEQLSFMDPDESVREQALARTRAVIDSASRLGAQVNIGRLRGRFFPHIPRERSLEWMYAAFGKAARYGETKGVTLALEPIEYLDCNNVNTVREGVEVVERVAHPCFRLMGDVFQMHLEERSIADAFREAGRHLSHVHLCDSNRRAPGRGNMDFAHIISCLKEIGYRGYVSVEILQIPDQDTALKESIRVLGPLLA